MPRAGTPSQTHSSPPLIMCHAIASRSHARVILTSRLWARGAAAVGLLALVGHTAWADDSIQFNRDVRPILSEHCFKCHGPDSASRKADLRLDRREAAIAAEALQPGKPEESELVRRIFSTDAEEMMPPVSVQKPLSPEQKEILKRWVASGAEYQPLWTFIPPKSPQPPAVKNAAWPRNPIDRFVLARLEAHGLAPAAEADRRTLARRLSLDLVGLPPEPAELEAFINDASPEAYERYVDHLLDSPQWGEHRARYWLDAARYADSNGIHFDNYREVWSYRDWVIQAFNRNVPFDRFTVEQLSGDLLPNHTLDQQVATGFNRCNITTNEGGAISEEYLVLYARDRTETVSQVWLGLTTGCAVCHDHKFDPITQKDFYSLAAFFNNTTQQAMDGNVKDTPPIVRVPQSQDRDRWQALPQEISGAQQQIQTRKQAAGADFSGWLAETANKDALAASIPTEGLAVHAALSEGQGTTVRVKLGDQVRDAPLAAGSAWDTGYISDKACGSRSGGVLEIAEAGDFERDAAFSYGAWIKLSKIDQTGAILARMDDQHDYRGWDLYFEDGHVGAHVVHKWPDDAAKAMSKSKIKPDAWNHVMVTYDGSSKAAGITVYINGTRQETKATSDGLKDTIRTEVPFKVGQRHSGQQLSDFVIQDVRVYGRLLPPQEVDTLAKVSRVASLAARSAQLNEMDRNELFEWWLSAEDKPYQALAKTAAGLEQERAAIEARGTLGHVMQERSEPATAYILFRGEYDKRRDPVTPNTPASLPPMPSDLPHNRLGFAQWLLRPEHPLTARVTVNRFWQEIFGTGIVRTTGDFGVNGEAPSHQELLDWLAVEFRESGWDVKRFFRLIVTSATYRQAAVSTPEKLEKDPDDRLLSRGVHFRMDGEMVRDYALAASGLLVRKVGGPSVRPYQPEGVWEAVAMPGSDTRDYRRDSGDNLYRRSLYTFWKRAAPPASMEIFNAPNREYCTVRRERTDTPLQALVTLNDPQFVEAARHLAEVALKEGGPTIESRLDLVAKRLLCRPLTAEELALAKASWQDLADFYQAHPQEAKELLAYGESKPDATMTPDGLAAWTMLCNELMNLDEVLNK